MADSNRTKRQLLQQAVTRDGIIEGAELGSWGHSAKMHADTSTFSATPLRSIRLGFTDSDEIELQASGVIVFVGPNNSGKTTVLSEIANALSGGTWPRAKIVRDFEFIDFEPADVHRWLHDIAGEGKREPQDDKVTLHALGKRKTTIVTMAGTLGSHSKEYIANSVLSWGTQLYSPEAIEPILEPQDQGDLLSSFSSLVGRLFHDEALKHRVREIIAGGIGQYLVIDPSENGKLTIRLAAAEPQVDERSLDRESLRILRSASSLDQFSKGIRSFVAQIVAASVHREPYYLVDEPDAYLHPPLARLAGRRMTEAVLKRKGFLAVATHSPDFISGCLDATARVTIVRLAYKDGRSRGLQISSDTLAQILKDPRIRSSSFVSGLFHDGVVVTEDDSDRVFYENIYGRLLRDKATLPMLQFVNVNGKSAMAKVTGPLNKFGVPAVALPDIDFLKAGGGEFEALLRAAGCSPSELIEMQRLRQSLRTQIASKDFKKRGVRAPGMVHPDTLYRLLQRVSQFGIFAPPFGELEQWLAQYDIRGRKHDWVQNALARLGTEPSDPSYVVPAQDDVWKFIEDICDWVSARRSSFTDVSP
ncbi:ATP-binding protein [Nitratireductor mangrovi]|uniref:ATP-binding protein n=1 Tax=Nitratireductor mangrovi TaxID=2599600 RepID=A0A5B8KU07_9HYPH|nr:TOPRIM nucleotidyl transferase/hydrolase domain-containing protein [Nitratireductor mangrovi]QDY99071.1 ATP-binding protein [Nitratireductor mangrovi]